jgi:glycosyltransferase involved in cell wall biosynthesis
LSWLKPGSRVRCLYSLGVPAIGDARVPDAAEFLGEFGGPVASSASSWARLPTELWNSPEKLQQLAAAGHAAVAHGHSTRQTARQWIRYFSQPSP